MLENKNIQAAMTAIRYCEGTSATDGYYYLFGSSPRNNLRFTGIQHPNNLQSHNGIDSTAAGAYQILYKTCVGLRQKYKIPDFTPRSQDLHCVALFDEQNVLNLVATGYFLRPDVMKKLATIWASLPESKYGQPTHSIADVTKVYEGSGGNVA